MNYPLLIYKNPKDIEKNKKLINHLQRILLIKTSKTGKNTNPQEE